MEYLALPSAAPPPVLQRDAPFKAILIADIPCDLDRQYQLSDWLLAAGCRYVMVTGRYSEGWTQMLDATNLARFNFETMPDAEVVIATDHPGDMLTDIFWFSRYSAMHPLTELKELVCVHLTDQPDQTAIEAAFAEVG